MNLNSRIPEYLVGKHQLPVTVISTALFSVIFLMATLPFSTTTWFKLRPGAEFLLTAMFLFLSVLLVIVSKMLMYSRREDQGFTYLKYYLWNIFEIVALAGLYTGISVTGNSMGILDLGEQTPDYMFLKSLVLGLISIGTPYIIVGQYFAINDKNNTIRLMNFGSVVSDTEHTPQTEKKITLYDNAGVLKLVISLYNLYYIEADDNYIKVWYEDSKGSIRQYMLRCRLKTVEESFSDSELARCHRKYIVNMTRVSLLTREKEGYVLELDRDGIEPIPVSRTYEENILSRFNSR